MPTLINRPFAQSGDVSVVPDASPSGYVNFQRGYTPDYALALEAGNVAAKAVERESMNWLLNLITDNLMFIQDHGAQQYFSSDLKPDGYPKNAIVVSNSGTPSAPEWRIFQSVVDGNTSAVPANGETESWQELTLPSEARKYIPMPAGGDAQNPYFVRGLISNFVDFDNITTSTTIVIQSDAVAALCSNIPNAVGATKAAGRLQVCAWQVDAQTFALQQYTSMNGYVFTRSYTSGAWSAWIQNATVQDVQIGTPNLASGKGAQDIILTVPAGYSWPPSAGSRLTIVNDVTTTGPVTVTIGANKVAVLGFDGGELPAGSIVGLLPFTIIYDGTVWRLLQAFGAAQIGVDASEPQQFVTKRQLDDLASKLITMGDVFEVGETRFLTNGTNPNTKLGAYGQVWTRLPDNMVIRTSGTARNGLATGGADSVTLTAAMLPLHNHSVNITTRQSGPWSNTTGDAGNHNHTGDTSQNGAHVHGMDSAGNHHHDSSWGEANTNDARYGVYDNTHNNFGSRKGGDWDNYKYNTSTNGNHVHNIQSSGSHTHGLNINYAGNHSHSYTLPAHTHDVVGNTGNAGQSVPTAVSTLPRYVVLNGWYRSA